MPVLRRSATLRLVVAGVTACAVAAAGAAAATTTPAPVVYAAPASGSYTLVGHGSGNGDGLSQWGAYGAAAVKKLTAAQILAFYYPTTTLTPVASDTSTVRVWLTATTSRTVKLVEVAPDAGHLTVSSGATTLTLPATDRATGKTVTAWRAEDLTAGAYLTLQSTVDGTHWTTYATSPWSGTAATAMTFRDASTGTVTAVLPSGSKETVRGTLAARVAGDHTVYAINALPMQSYLDSVVPMEMPPSWSAAALQAQAVASRTYAAFMRTQRASMIYDVRGDSADQAYGGVAREVTASTAAVTATDGQLLEVSGAPIFAQYGAADGGYTTQGTVAGKPVAYLPAKADPYDGLEKSSANTWTVTLKVSTLTTYYRKLTGDAAATFTAIEVDSRDGHGAEGGRITAMKLLGTSKGASLPESVSPASFASYCGLPTTWWQPQTSTTTSA